MKYKRLSLDEREQIFAFVNQGKTNRMIAAALNRSHTTISKELRRCGTKFEYSSSKAHHQARGSATHRGRKRIIDIRPEVFNDVLKRLATKHPRKRLINDI